MPLPIHIKETFDSFSPVALEEMDNVRLMNRVDTKYVLSVKKLPELLTRINGEYRILEVNKNRLLSYDTIYLDTIDRIFYNQHVLGKPERNKVRFRKYESTGITFLEVKKKTRKNRTIKWRIENNLSDNNICDQKAMEFIKEHIQGDLPVLKPVLTSRFNRITLVGSVIKERITIDYDLSYSDREGNQRAMPSLAIIEVKRETFSAGSPFAVILKDCLIRPTGFSKYCVGTAFLYDLPRKNILKPKLLLINKIENEFNRHFIS